MSILSSHAASWHSDKWYRWAWYIWPQAISLLRVGWLFVGALLKPTPWAQPKPSTPAQCNAFVQLRDDAQKKALAVRTAVEHKVDRKEICTLVQPYYAAESAVVKFLEENKTRCGIPDEAIKAAKDNHEHTDKFRTVTCSEAPGPKPESDEKICGYPNSASDLNACSRLIDAGRTEFYFWRARGYLRFEDYDRAIEDLSKFIQLNPNDVGALNDRGSAYERKGELNKALADFREALSHGSTTASEDINRVERAIALLQATICSQGNSRDALNACSRLIDSGQLKFYFRRGEIYFRNGDSDRAIADLSAFILLPLDLRGNPNSVEALNDRGVSYAEKRDYDRAIADYTEAIRLDRGSALSYSNRGFAYEEKGELDKALADFREAQNNGSTTASEDIDRVERKIASLRSKYVVNGLDGLSLGGRVSPQSNGYQEYQCRPSEQFEGVTWCTKQPVEEEARGSYRSSYTIAHSRDETIYYLNRFLEPAFFNAGEVDNDIERLSGKFGEQARRVRPHVRLGPNTDGIIATWGKVALEPLDATGTSELAAGRSPRKGILVDFLGNLSESARHGLDVYRVTGGPGFVWAASFNPQGRGTLRFFRN
jgi:tetratricopeptide (TPR) repeat protein